MTRSWFTDIFVGGKKCVLFDDIGRHKHLTLHTEIDEKGKIKEVSLVQDNWRGRSYYTVRGIE